MRAVPLVVVCAASVFGGCAQAQAPTSADATPGRADASSAFDAPGADTAVGLDASQVSCTAGATCAAAVQLGSVSGDTGAATVQGSGYQSAWYQVRISENDSDVFGVPMNVTATLTSPAGINYDLYLYLNTGSDVIECASATQSSTSTGTSDSAHLSWGESGTFSNGSNDDRTLSVEVRYVSGTCSMAKPFQLVISGNQ